MNKVRIATLKAQEVDLKVRREGKKIVLTIPEAVEQEGSVEDTEREHVDGRKTPCNCGAHPHKPGKSCFLSCGHMSSRNLDQNQLSAASAGALL